MKYVDHVDPFQGNGSIDLPEPYPPASAWHFIKGLTGNTSPGAVLPFGKYSCVAYDGAYPTGYGVNTINSGEKIRPLYDRKKMIGISHFQQSGTGAIRVYYNYALTVPHYGAAPDFSPRDILAEEAHPGYYSVSVGGISAETTVSAAAALHRYHFSADDAYISFDLANDGLYSDVLRGPASGTVTVCGADTLEVEMTLSGVVLYFAIHVTGGEFRGLFRGGERTCARNLTLPPDSRERFGGTFAVPRECEVRLAVSAVSAEHARRLLAVATRSFDAVREAASAAWEEALSRVEVTTDDAREERIFYSNLYHSLVKPCKWSGEGFFFREDKNRSGPFVLDLATMWDIYKTQLPLVYTLFPEIGEKVLATFFAFGSEYGYFPHCLLLSSNLSLEAKQARLLAEYTICDAYWRGVPADYPALIRLSVRDAERFGDFREGKCEYASHVLDMSEAFASLALVADDLGMCEEAAYFREGSRHVLEAFDTDGIMRAESPYYEGNRYNYSFRPLHDTAARIAVAGTDRMRTEALRFFGFTHEDDFTSRFEGFNNETDMEAPYFLHYLGLRDRMCEVLASGTDCMFGTGSGGIPGNADSGGLTACYLWNAIGIFPLTGQPRVLVGLPRYRKTVLRLPSSDLPVTRVGEGIYTDSATFNGVPLTDWTIPVRTLMQGGEVKIVIREHAIP